MRWSEFFKGVIIGATLWVVFIFFSPMSCDGNYDLRDAVSKRPDHVVRKGFDEKVECDEPITNVLVTLVMFETIDDLHEFAAEEYDLEPDFDGFSDCELVTSHNMSHCDVFIVRPRIVDGWNMWTLGHEVFHGVCGPDFHE